ncbi:DnaB-like helicase C-terminal domain-containing protein [Bacillus anthracis]
MSTTQKISSKERIHRAGSERALIGICLNKPDQLILAGKNKYQVEHGIKLIVFDYIKLPSSNSNLGDKEFQALGYLTSGLKDLAGMLQVPIISAVQLNRSAVGNDDINESSIAGSDRILQLANRSVLPP